MGVGGYRHEPGRFTPGKHTRYPLFRRLGGPQGWSGRVQIISPIPEFEHQTVEPAGNRYTDWATPAPDSNHNVFIILFREISTVYSEYHTETVTEGWGTALQAGRSRVRFPMVSLKIFIDIILPAALWPLGWPSLQHERVPGIFPGG